MLEEREIAKALRKLYGVTAQLRTAEGTMRTSTNIFEWSNLKYFSEQKI